MTAPVLLDLDDHGDFLDPETGAPVSPERVPRFLEKWLSVPKDATDIVVFVHGWRNTRATADRRARQFFSLVDERYETAAETYAGLGRWHGFYVIVRWPSMSNPFLTGYRRIRDRAHRMTTEGRAAEALGHLLGYLNAERRLPGGPPSLRTVDGQYLHCVGHSFGGRFVVEAVQAAAGDGPPVLGWNREDSRYPYTVDTVVVFQMAARPDVFAGRFAPMLKSAPINGPVVLTRSRADRATGLWHRLAEGTRGIGHVGAQVPVEHLGTTALHETTTVYRRSELDQRIVNVEAGWRFRRGRWWHPAGAHSDIWYPESAHLLLSLAELAR
ncbi:alpha/beta hydrolase [Amycolatopsis sp. H6(2020)]|nr:alpha/beta hydrolase [Amycolatopsis sp. H6(2020)]